ncbi:MAG TPA: hypothetical protein VIJ88_00315 [Candidatus Paceibacterota bacterium]
MGLFSSGASFCTIVLSIVSLINLTVGVLLALAVVVFFWGLVRFISESGDAHGHTEGKERIIWSLIAIFVLVSVWGILALMSVAFFGGTATGGGTNGCSGAVPTTGSSSQPSVYGSLY